MQCNRSERYSKQREEGKGETFVWSALILSSGISSFHLETLDKHTQRQSGHLSSGKAKAPDLHHTENLSLQRDLNRKGEERSDF